MPVPGPADVLVRVDALAVNHVDTFVRSGAYRTETPFPFIIGRDLAGTVTATGPDVSGFRPGDRVWSNSLGHDGRQGSFAQWASVPVERLYRLPDDGFAISNASVRDLDEAAALINRLLAAGQLRSRIGATLSLDEAARAHQLQAARGADRPKGRIVVRP